MKDTTPRTGLRFFIKDGKGFVSGTRSEDTFRVWQTLSPRPAHGFVGSARLTKQLEFVSVRLPNQNSFANFRE